MFDMSQIDEDEFHVDLGFMYGLPSKASDVLEEPCVGYTTLPRRCCLKDLVKRFNALTFTDPDSVQSELHSGLSFSQEPTRVPGSLSFSS